MVWLFLPKYKENYETAYIYYLNIVIAGSSRVSIKEKKTMVWRPVQNTNFKCNGQTIEIVTHRSIFF